MHTNTLVAQLARPKLAAQHYKYLYMDNDVLIVTSVAQHSAIVEAIANNNLDLASNRLEEN